METNYGPVFLPHSLRGLLPYYMDSLSDGIRNKNELIGILFRLLFTLKCQRGYHASIPQRLSFNTSRISDEIISQSSITLYPIRFAFILTLVT
jgi:hypothetical protein